MTVTERLAASVRRTPVTWVLLLAGIAFAVVGFVTLAAWPFLVMAALAVFRFALLVWNLRHPQGRQW